MAELRQRFGLLRSLAFEVRLVKNNSDEQFAGIANEALEGAVFETFLVKVLVFSDLLLVPTQENGGFLAESLRVLGNCKVILEVLHLVSVEEYRLAGPAHESEGRGLVFVLSAVVKVILTGDTRAVLAAGNVRLKDGSIDATSGT